MIKQVNVPSCPVCSVRVDMAVVVDKSKPPLPNEPANFFGDTATFEHRTMCNMGWYIHYVTEDGRHTLALAIHLSKEKHNE
ncbi:MAG: hypothetical protein DRI46_12160 [Chloroflexi bacterium]|nr:MAG: hypothetical protein DRI46_12160 [Chloroflexota bacterium]